MELVPFLMSDVQFVWILRIAVWANRTTEHHLIDCVVNFYHMVRINHVRATWSMILLTRWKLWAQRRFLIGDRNTVKFAPLHRSCSVQPEKASRRNGA